MSGVKVNEAIKYSHRYESGYKRKVNTWLQTFHEFIQEGDIDDFAGDGDDEGMGTGPRNLSGNIDMESVASDLPNPMDLYYAVVFQRSILLTLCSKVGRLVLL